MLSFIKIAKVKKQSLANQQYTCFVTSVLCACVRDIKYLSKVNNTDGYTPLPRVTLIHYVVTCLACIRFTLKFNLN